MIRGIIELFVLDLFVFDILLLEMSLCVVFTFMLSCIDLFVLAKDARSVRALCPMTTGFQRQMS